MRNDPLRLRQTSERSKSRERRENGERRNSHDQAGIGRGGSSEALRWAWPAHTVPRGSQLGCAVLTRRVVPSLGSPAAGGLGTNLTPPAPSTWPVCPRSQPTRVAPRRTSPSPRMKPATIRLSSLAPRSASSFRPRAARASGRPRELGRLPAAGRPCSCCPAHVLPGGRHSNPRAPMIWSSEATQVTSGSPKKKL